MADTSQALAERRDAPAFDASKVTDQKRFVRGEQMLLARRCLRIRDEIHSAPWRIMIMAGAAPEGEINAIRELMPKAHITAIDNDERCLTAALNCGADEVVHVDLTEWGEYENTFRKKPAAKLGDRRFDVVCLDLCANVNATTKKMARVYRSLVAHYGVYIVNFSYGRDVVELFDDARLALVEGASKSRGPHRLSLPAQISLHRSVGHGLSRERHADVLSPPPYDKSRPFVCPN
jgi:hypothetical protein